MDSKFNNYVAQIQTEQMIWPAYYHEQNKNYEHILPLNKEVKILECGPGRGYFTDWLICKGYENITLVELDEENNDFLKNKYKNFPNIHIVKNDMTGYLKTTSCSFSLIISRMVLEHIPVDQISDVFSYGKKCLDEGGIMVHETINAANFIYGSYYRYNDFSHSISFTAKSLREFAGEQVTVREYKRPSIFTIIKSKFTKEVASSVDELKARISLQKTGTEPLTKKKNRLSIYKGLVYHVITSLRWSLSRLITYIFYKEITTIYSHFLIVELRK